MPTRTVVAALVLAVLATGADANEPFYKGKRLILLINFAAGGPADIEGRIFARHFARHIDGVPGHRDLEPRRRRRSRRHQLSWRSRAARRNVRRLSDGRRMELRRRSGRLPHRLRHLRVHRLSARQHRLFRAHRHAAWREGRREPVARDGAGGRWVGRRLLEGPEDTSVPRYPRCAVQICHWLPQRRAGSISPSARRDQFLFGILAELFRSRSSRRWSSPAKRSRSGTTRSMTGGRLHRSSRWTTSGCRASSTSIAR